jgi:1-deoxyxylulose-5-phosphate synthase
MTQRPEPYEKFMTDGVFDALEEMERMAADRDVSMGGLALAWLLSEPRVSFVVVGPTRPEHLEPVREALAVQLGEDERRTIGSLFS